MKKFIKFLVILFIIGLGIYIFCPSIESIVQKVVREQGSKVTGTEVTLGGFDMNLRQGKIEIRGLTIANPDNYTQPHIMSIGRVAVQVDLKSLLKKTIIVESVEIEKPQLTYEMRSVTQNNISQLMENIEKNTAQPESQQKAKKKAEKTSEKDKSEGKKVIINHLNVTDGNITLAASLVGKGVSADMSLPDIKLKDLGKEKNKNGTDVITTVKNVLNKILQTAYDTVVGSNVVDMKNAAKEGLEAVVEGVKEKSNLKDWFGFGK